MSVLVEAVERVVATDAEHAPDEGTLVERVGVYFAAQQELEKVLREELSLDGQLALLSALVEMLGDPFERDLNADFLESVEGP